MTASGTHATYSASILTGTTAHCEAGQWKRCAGPRFVSLVAAERLEAKGKLDYTRFSEVRLKV